MKLRYPVFVISILLVAVLASLFWRLNSRDLVTLDSSLPTSGVLLSPTMDFPESTKKIRSADIPGVEAIYNFEAIIPASWQAEAIPSIAAISFFSPNSPDATNLEKSQIFIRYFRANTFLTLPTVDILQRTPTTINGRPAVRYDIIKKPTAPNFPNQPAWRNGHHIVTDIRISADPETVYYVVAKRPELDENIYQKFLKDLLLTSHN